MRGEIFILIQRSIWGIE